MTRLLWCLILLGFSAPVPASEPLAGAAPDPCLRLDTRLGAITLRFDRAAAPGAVATIERLARGPLYDLDSLPNPDAARTTGYFDGLAFDYARPKLELRLPVRPPAAAFTVEAELDARPLGLDEKRIADAGEAMNALQIELLPALKRPSSERRSTPRLEEWAKRFEQGYDASFLVGTSRREQLEAIGYRFRDGLASRRPTRGAVLLVPGSPTEATLGLSILLADHPNRTGKWVVVGEIADGLEVADAIADRPLAEAALRDFRPRTPVGLDRVQLLDSCETTNKGETR